MFGKSSANRSSPCTVTGGLLARLKNGLLDEDAFKSDIGSASNALGNRSKSSIVDGGYTGHLVSSNATSAYSGIYGTGSSSKS